MSIFTDHLTSWAIIVVVAAWILFGSALATCGIAENIEMAPMGMTPKEAALGSAVTLSSVLCVTIIALLVYFVTTFSI